MAAVEKKGAPVDELGCDSSSCGICKSLLCKPITLFCQHNFCQHCIRKNGTGKCPVCKVKTFVPPETNKLLEQMLIEKHGKAAYDVRLAEIAKLAEEEATDAKREEMRREMWREVMDTIEPPLQRLPQEAIWRSGGHMCVAGQVVDRQPWWKRLPRNLGSTVADDPYRPLVHAAIVGTCIWAVNIVCHTFGK